MREFIKLAVLARHMGPRSRRSNGWVTARVSAFGVMTATNYQVTLC